MRRIERSSPLGVRYVAPEVTFVAIVRRLVPSSAWLDKAVRMAEGQLRIAKSDLFPFPACRMSPGGPTEARLRIRRREPGIGRRGRTSAPIGDLSARPAETDYRIRRTTAGPNLVSRWQVADIAEYMWSHCGENACSS